MKVLYVWDADYPWDIRVEKICHSLASHDIKVHLVARNLKRRTPTEKIGPIHVHRLPVFRGDRVNYSLSFPLFFSPVWLRKIGSIVSSEGIDLIIVRDLPLAPAGLLIGGRRGLPVVFDMAEDYIAMIEDIWRVRKFQGLNLIVRNPYLARLVEKACLPRFQDILVVTEEALGVAVKGGADARNVHIVGNTPPIERASEAGETNVPPAIADRMRSCFTGIYIGGLQMGRGIQYVFEAIPEIRTRIPEFLFVVVGDGYAAGRLREEAERLGVQDAVIFTGWVPNEHIGEYTRLARFGIIPHNVTRHTNTTLPNKLFDYMACGRAVLASDAVPLKRIVEETGCGLCFKGGDVADLAGNVIRMGHDGVDGYGHRGRKAFLDRYYWGIDEKVLLETVKKYMPRNTGRRSE